jgi:hypothetical protein
MATKRSGHRPAGGQHSKNVVEKPVKVGRRAEAINERGVSQIGSSMGNKVTDKAKSLSRSIEPVIGAQRGPTQPGGFPQGNAVAAATVCGPGGSREVSKSGSQGVQGSVNPGVARPVTPGPKDILRDYGPEISRGRR